MRPLLYFVELCTKCFQQLREVVISLKVTERFTCSPVAFWVGKSDSETKYNVNKTLKHHLWMWVPWLYWHLYVLCWLRDSSGRNVWVIHLQNTEHSKYSKTQKWVGRVFLDTIFFIYSSKAIKEGPQCHHLIILRFDISRWHLQRINRHLIDIEEKKRM